LGDIEFNQVITNFQDLPENVILDETKFRNGIIGNQILSRFDVWFDYIEEKLYLKPGRKINKKFNMDKSGMIVFATGQNLNVYVVQDIIEGSPADLAGVMVGDVIKKIQGFPAKVFSLNGIIRKLQKKTGKKIRMQILRDKQIINIRFKLKDLV
jgi:C-terminal processing protease CtpA/Prc